jgi:uncharacterized protein
MRRSLFENYEPELARQPRLRPNFIALAVQFSARFATAIVLFWLVFTCACALYSINYVKINSFKNLNFSLTSKPARDMARFEKNFPNLYGLSSLTLSSKNAENIKQARKELQAKLEDRADLFANVLSPGAGNYYDVNGLLYLSSEQVKEHVDYALALRPLFQALAEQPTTDSLATLVNQVSVSIELGRDPQALDDLFREAAKSTQALMKGQERPVDWTLIAGLNADPSPNDAHFIVVPHPDMNDEAKAFLDKAIKDVIAPYSNRPDKIFVFEEVGSSDQAVEPPKSAAPNIVPLVVIATVLSAFVFFAMLGQFSLAAMLAGPALVTLSVASALTTLLLRDVALSFWLIILGLALCTLHFSARLTFASLEAFTAARSRTTALMLAAQKQGWVVLWLWPVMLAPWIGWAMIGDHTFALLTVVVALSLLIGCAASITLAPAIASLTSGSIQWTAAEWLVPVHETVFATPAWKYVVRGLLTLPVAAAAAGFWLSPHILRINEKLPSQLEKPVYVLAEAQTDVERILSQLETIPQAEKVQWLGTFLPSKFSEKQTQLIRLKDQFIPTTPSQPQDPLVLRDQISTLLASLQNIANSQATRPALAAAATEFRQSLELLSATSQDTEIALFEKRMFGAFNVLSQRAEALAATAQPTIDALDPRLKSLFLSDDGLFRITVTAKKGSSQSELASKLAELGLAVVNPTLVAKTKKAQTLRTSFIILAAAGLGLLALAVGVRNLSRMLVFVISTAIIFGLAALLAVWRNAAAEPLPLLVLTITLSHLFAYCAILSLKKPISNRAVPEAIHATEAWVAPLLILAVALPSLLLKTGGGATPLIDLATLVCAATAVAGVLLEPLNKKLT